MFKYKGYYYKLRLKNDISVRFALFRHIPVWFRHVFYANFNLDRADNCIKMAHKNAKQAADNELSMIRYRKERKKKLKEAKKAIKSSKLHRFAIDTEKL